MVLCIHSTCLFFLLNTWVDWLSQPPLREDGTRRLKSHPLYAGPPTAPWEILPPLSLSPVPGWLYKILWKTLRPLENGDIFYYLLSIY